MTTQKVTLYSNCKQIMCVIVSLEVRKRSGVFLCKRTRVQYGPHIAEYTAHTIQEGKFLSIIVLYISVERFSQTLKLYIIY